MVKAWNLIVLPNINREEILPNRVTQSCYLITANQDEMLLVVLLVVLPVV